MKNLTSLFALLLIVTEIPAQNPKEKELVFVACKTGELIIDGNSFGIVEADDAKPKRLTFGDHYVQLKTGSEKINLSLIIDENTKSIIKIGCVEKVEGKGVRLINKNISLTGLLSNSTEDNIIGLDKDDEIIVNSMVTNKKGTATIFITEYSKSTEIYRKQDFKTLENEVIKIPSKGVYKITLYTDALFGKEAKLTVDRVAAKSSPSSFNTIPIRVYDTTWTEVIKTTTRVYSTSNLDHNNKTSISINLPPNTSYWTYWIGVDQQLQDNMTAFVKNLSPVLSAFSVNPLVLFGMKLIPSLPMMKTPATVDYIFTDTKNSLAFSNGQAYTYYKFKHADNISSDYSIINGNVADLVLSLTNKNLTKGYNIDVRAVAFIIRSKLVLAE